ncbi:MULTISPECIES: membrane integrity-associated transporter subunit PqiC [unclassified Pseudomonas]|uniref:PqiC family protein n=1 Tax=unclassified Pseudomonas TaxID=196821 RepID=UPI000A1F19B1|nr:MULTISPECIES: PqiC family protein [unclassified Pseudomonas]
MALPLKFTVLAACLLLGACRSDPISFHTLTPAQPPAGKSAGEITIEGISVPPQVDRPQIVIRQGNSGLAILETEWWGASLGDELRSALADQLSNAGGQRKVSVRIDVQRFDSIPGQYGLIDVKWRLRQADAGDNGLVACRSVLQTPSGPTIDDLVTAQQNNVRRLAAMISQAAGSSRGCPPAS